ncbi:hypothetical protein E3N88_13770 [Mikania micrantha]|uniref:Uncharacterized protein n=1 Tax=Mikania micrantha TaxID=192012 RepID=A0A5N6NZF7_9ASTR|nr:hypothetical protein E3N88_13770 [Mikania micrantha]
MIIERYNGSRDFFPNWDEILTLPNNDLKELHHKNLDNADTEYEHRKINSGRFAKKNYRCTSLPRKTLADHDTFGRQPLHRKTSNDSEDNLIFRNN